LTGAGTKRGGRAGLVVGTLLIVAPLIAVYAFNVSSNASAREQARTECARIRAAVPARWEALEPAARGMFEEDTPVVERLVLGMGADTCEALDEELSSPMAWGWGRTWSAPAASAEELRELHDVTERAAERCPRVMGVLLARSAGAAPASEREAQVREGCESMLVPLERFASLPSESAEPIALWDWPAHLREIADALEATGSP